MMHKLISLSTAARPTGSPPQKRLFKVASGPFKGKMALLYSDSPSGISLKVSDSPYSSWSDPQVIANNSADLPFSAFIGNDGHIYLVYVDTNFALKFIRLTFSGGAWISGSVSTVINVEQSRSPFILIDSEGILHCFFDMHRVSTDLRHTIRVKTSVDGGATWGSGPSEMGTALSSAYIEQGYVAACQSFSKIYAVYCVNRNSLRYRVYDLSSQSWNSEQTTAEYDYIDDDFDIAPSGDGKIGVVYAPSVDSRIYLKEFDGLTWSGQIEVQSALSKSPQIAYYDNKPFIIYAQHLGNDYFITRIAVKTAAEFSSSNLLDSFGNFEKVLLYNAGAASQYQDKSTAAANTTTGDIFHSESQGLLDSVDDCLYLGRQSKFFTASIILSTPGIGGVVIWEYYNGSQWVAFTPDSGAYHFASSDSLLYLWQDGNSMPSNWQLGLVNNLSAFWIRARVTTGFSVNPIGSQILAAVKCDDLSLVRGM
jgi:hypothetical protein